MEVIKMKKKFFSSILLAIFIFAAFIVSVNAATGSEIASKAREQLGKSYSSTDRLGPDSFDCSGLVYYVCNQLGISMSSGNCNSQMSYGTAVDYSAFKSSFDCSNLQEGDLIFFDYGSDGVPDHVGIYSGNGNMIDALTSSYYGYKVVEHSINVVGNSSVSSTKKFYQYTCAVKRVAQAEITDTTPPTINSLTISDKSSSSFTINCRANETLSRAYIIVYGPGGNSGQGFNINDINSKSFSKVINTSDYGGTGDYIVHVYVFDSAGNSTGETTDSFLIESLTVNSYTVSKISSSSFTLYCSANQVISRAYIIIYGPGGNSGQGFNINDINSKSFSKVINTSDYGGTGDYVAHVYIFDSAGNSAGGTTDKFTIESLKVQNYTATNITENSFTLTCTANQIISRAYIIIYGPGGNSGQGFNINDINSKSFSKVINTSDYGGNGTYIAHIYIFDSAENSVGSKTEYFTVPVISTYTTPFTLTQYSNYADVTNNSSQPQIAAIIIAEYNSNGVLLNTDTSNISFAAGETRTFTHDSGIYKIFVWDSLNGMIPLNK
jgi:hypothetical protein